MPTDVRFGPSLPTERELRLLGDLAGKRVLELGCPYPDNLAAYVARGAKAIAVDA
jgi:hypothetical protein